MKILITGSQGFMAKNLAAHLAYRKDIQLYLSNRETPQKELEAMLDEADIVAHLAGVNRPGNPDEFQKVNFGLTEFLINKLETRNRFYQFHYTSSSQAQDENPYGQSKKAAEEYIQSNLKNGTAVIYRFPGVFGKWGKPNYNSVVATFCYNVARNLPIQVSDETKEIHLIYVDDVVRIILDQIQHFPEKGSIRFAESSPTYTIKLGELAIHLQSFRNSRTTLVLPEVGDPFIKKLYSTYLSYLPENAFEYPLTLREDERGSLFELLKTNLAGQIFLSTTYPGITRGNHFHHTKTEKFCVVSGEGLIRFRKIGGDEIIEYAVSGKNPVVVDIPPGYTHNITNVGKENMITLFWANEIFDPSAPDTQFEKV